MNSVQLPEVTKISKKFQNERARERNLAMSGKKKTQKSNIANQDVGSFLSLLPNSYPV